MGDIDEWRKTQEEEDILSVSSGSGLKLWGSYSFTESKPSEFIIGIYIKSLVLLNTHTMTFRN